jgi:hypothetical protein
MQTDGAKQDLSIQQKPIGFRLDNDFGRPKVVFPER